MIHLDSIVSRDNKKFIFNELGTEAVVMNIESGDYLGLNEVSSEIWKSMDEPIKAEDIVKHLLQRFNVSEGTCQQQTLAFLNKMKSHGMITQQ